MAKESQKRPTDAELNLLRVLWLRGPSTVREVYEQLNTVKPQRPIGYTTVLKLLQIMTEKGHVHRDESVRPQIYRARRSQGQTQKQLVRDLLDKVFSGSPGKLVLHALSLEKASPEEREQIRQMLDELEERNQ